MKKSLKRLLIAIAVLMLIGAISEIVSPDDPDPPSSTAPIETPAPTKQTEQPDAENEPVVKETPLTPVETSRPADTTYVAPEPSVPPEPPAHGQDAVPKGNTVWIPQSGSKYHSNPGCSNMINPTQVTESEAISMGYTPCKRCY